MRFAAVSRGRERLILGLITVAWPLTIGVLATFMALHEGIDSWFGFTQLWVVHGIFALTALSALAVLVFPSYRACSSVFVVVAGWAFLGRAWSVWTGGTASGASDLVARAVGGTAWAAIAIATLTFHLLHVAAALAARADAAVDGGLD